MSGGWIPIGFKRLNLKCNQRRKRRCWKQTNNLLYPPKESTKELFKINHEIFLSLRSSFKFSRPPHFLKQLGRWNSKKTNILIETNLFNVLKRWADFSLLIILKLRKCWNQLTDKYHKNSFLKFFFQVHGFLQLFSSKSL